MARIRTIKPEFWTSEQIVECSRDARLLFIGMWNFADDSGVLPASAKSLKMRVFPAEDDIDSASVLRMLGELSANGLIEEYSVENKSFWIITGWVHQKIDQPTFKYPLKNGKVPETVRRTSTERSPPEGKGREGKGKEKKKKISSTGSTGKPNSGTRLPDDWTLPDEWREWAIAQGPPPARIDHEAAKFADYWHAVPGAKGRKADWEATWRNWIRKALENYGGGGNGGTGGQYRESGAQRLGRICGASAYDSTAPDGTTG